MRETEHHYSVAMRELPLEERPRERLLRNGAPALSTQELLAILLRTGTAGCSALSLADRLLHEHRGLRGLANAEIGELARTPGIGKVKAIEIAACVELGKRIAAYPEESRPELSTPGAVANLLMPEMRELKVEQFRVLILDTKNRLIRMRVVSQGTLDASLVHPREVLREAIVAAGAGIIAVHNHPSGDPAPSREDEEVTRRLIDASNLIGIALLDHVIFGDQRWVSLRQLWGTWPCSP